MVKYRYLIFDFNGTLIDSSEIMHDIVDDLITKSRFTGITSKDVENRRSLPLVKKIKVLIFTARYLRRFFQLYDKKDVSKIKFADGVKSMLIFFNERGYSYSILSSNSADMIKDFFELHQIPVDSIYKSNVLYGKRKAIKSFIKEKGCKASDILYVGDEKRDVAACNKCGVDTVFVNWGIGTSEDIARYNVKAVVQTPGELIGHVLN